MAGDWLKVEICTPDKSEIWCIAQDLEIEPDAAFGKVFRVWAWFDQQTEDGNAPSVTKNLLDRLVGVTGFCDAMVRSGWMEDKKGVIAIPNFDRHNGESGKKRAQQARRTAKSRAKKSNASVTLDALPREDNREEKNKKNISAKESPEVVDSESRGKAEPETPPLAAAGILAPAGFENTQPLVSVLAREGFTHDHVHKPRAMVTIAGWVRKGLTAENLSAVIAMTRSRNPGKAISSPLYLDGPVNDFLEAQSPDSPESLGDWARVPMDENKLWDWAKKHGYPDPGRTEKTRDYKARLIQLAMDRKKQFLEEHEKKAKEEEF